MVFQYQYQYQYQLQRGLGLTTYDSFSQILRDTYSNPIIVSLLVAVTPLVLYHLYDRHPKVLKGISYFLGVLPGVLLTYLIYVYFQKTDFVKLVASFLGLTIYLFAVYEYLEWRRDTPERRAKAIFMETFALKKKRDYSSFFFALFAIGFGFLIFTQSLFFVAVTSNSMAPTFWATDLVVIQSMSKDLKVGDIVVFNNPNVDFDEKVIHRIHSMEFDKIRTKGDNNNEPDEWILDKKDILGNAVRFNSKPLVVKKVGRYFIKGFDLQKEADPSYRVLRWGMSNIRTYGPVYLVLIFLLIILFQAEQPEKGKFY